MPGLFGGFIFWCNFQSFLSSIRTWWEVAGGKSFDPYNSLRLAILVADNISSKVKMGFSSLIMSIFLFL